MGPQDEAGLRRWVETALANAEAGTERPFATIDRATGRAIGSSRYLSIVPEHRRLEIGWTWVGIGLPADRRQPRGEAAPADPRLRDARRQPGRVQDPLAQRAVAQRPGRHRRDVRGRLPEPHDHARRLAPALGLLQHHRRGVAGGQGALVAGLRPMSAARRPQSLTATSSLGDPLRSSADGRLDRRRRTGRPSLGGTALRGFIVGTIVTAIAFYVLTKVLPQYTGSTWSPTTASSSGSSSWRSIFGARQRPRSGRSSGSLALPLTFMTMGLVGFAINAGLLLLTAVIAQRGQVRPDRRRLPAGPADGRHHRGRRSSARSS